MQTGPSINRRFQSALLCAIDRLLSAQAAGGPAGDNGPESYGYDPTTGSPASKAGVSYTYDDALHKHAVTGLSNGSSFSYDPNGSMITRNLGGQNFNLSYDAENRMTGVTGAATANFVYDDTGARVIAAEGDTMTVYVGSYFEWHGTITDTVKYYYAGTVRVAMRKGDGQALFLLGDHLGSTNRLVHADGTPLTPGGMRLYKAWGETRYEPDGLLATEYRYTGQFEQQTIGLYYYRARWYDASIMRFVSPDSIIPLMQGLQAWDRYTYTNNNPTNFTDPSGHRLCDLGLEENCDHGTWQPTPTERYKEQLRNKFGWRVEYEVSEEFLFSLLQFSYSYERIVIQAPISTDALNSLATGFNLLAWGTDLYAVGVVTAGGIFGAGVPAALLPAGVPEVPVVTGVAGVAIAELYVQPIIFAGNILASASTLLSILADIRDPRIIPPTSSTLNSITLTGIGWRSNEAYFSFFFQSVAVANDFGWTRFPFYVR